MEVSTEGIDPGEAYDYWRHIAYYDFCADPRPGGRGAGFRASAQVLVTTKGDLCVYRSDAVSGRRTPRQIRTDGLDRFSFGMVLCGRRRYRDEDDGVAIATPGDFFCYDATRPSRVAWTAHRGIHFSLSRRLIEEASGWSIPPAADGMRALTASPLAPFLRSQLVLLARHLGSLPPVERAVAFDQAVDLALAVMAQAFRAQGADAVRSAYFVGAQRYIEQHLLDPNLDALRVAMALKCSRATLYRAFADQNLTVVRYIREARLNEAMRRLRLVSAGATIESLAVQCGFNSVSSFRRAFREKFGLNPSEVREAQSDQCS